MLCVSSPAQGRSFNALHPRREIKRARWMAAVTTLSVRPPPPSPLPPPRYFAGIRHTKGMQRNGTMPPMVLQTTHGDPVRQHTQPPNSACLAGRARPAAPRGDLPPAGLATPPALRLTCFSMSSCTRGGAPGPGGSGAVRRARCSPFNAPPSHTRQGVPNVSCATLLPRLADDIPDPALHGKAS
jgi:hypothetical protein